MTSAEYVVLQVACHVAGAGLMMGAAISSGSIEFRQSGHCVSAEQATNWASRCNAPLEFTRPSADHSGSGRRALHDGWRLGEDNRLGAAVAPEAS